MKKLAVLFALVIFISCQEGKEPAAKMVQVKMDISTVTMLDSIIKSSDSNYTKPYKRSDFVTAVYYINKASKTVCQVMKDSAENIRQIIVSKNNIRTFFAQYYPNGQLMATLQLDTFGQYNGPAVYYYQNGNKQTEGVYKSGFHTGKWKNYDEAGKLLSVDEYDSNGQRVTTVNK